MQLHVSAQNGRNYTKGSSARSSGKISANGAPAAAGLCMDFCEIWDFRFWIWCMFDIIGDQARRLSAQRSLLTPGLF